MFGLRLLLTLVFVSLAAPAVALPRFAARVGADCSLCHVSPSGGGVRTRYGSQVFQRLALPLDLGEASDDHLDFSGQVTDWLTVGGDLRGVYLYSATHAEGATPAPEAVSTFFLMQADLYAAAQLHEQLSLVLDLGAYSGFEAYLWWSLDRTATTFDLGVRLGHFMPSFGLRDVNHDLYTRGGVGLGPTDRDTGLELWVLLGPLRLTTGLVNGTLNDVALDRNGARPRSFEKAIYGRATAQLGPNWLPIQLGASAYYNRNVDSPNPLFVGAVDPVAAGEGVDELRLSAFLLVGLGRFSYQAEVVFVRDWMAAGVPGRLSGYTSAQELGVQVIQGVEVLGTLEFREPDLSLVDDATIRAGAAVVLFPLPFLDLRVMARQAFVPSPQGGDVTDVLCLAHGAF